MTNKKPNQKISRRKAILFTIVPIAALFLAGEIVLRLIGYAPPETCYVSAPGVHHLHKPLYNGFYADKPLTTNKWGLRDDDFPKEKPPGEFRILCLGDSVTFGHGIDNGEDYPKKLEELLNARPGDAKRYQVINTGADAYTTHEEVEYYLRYGKDFDPDKVILGVCLNDVTTTNLPLDIPMKKYLKMSAYFFFFKDMRSRIILSDIKERDKQIYGLRDDVLQAGISPETEKGWERVFGELRRLKTAMGPRASNDLLIVIFPTRKQVKENDATGAQDRVAAFCRTEGLRYFDPLPILRAEPRETYVDELHFNPLGCVVFAKALEPLY